MKKNSWYTSVTTTLSLGATALVSPAIASTNNGLIFKEVNTSNSTVGNMYLGQGSLGNTTLNGQLTSGINKYAFGALLFTATESGSFTYGQTSAPIDTVMILYRGVFDPLAPGNGQLVGNDDTPRTAHYSILGDDTIPIFCGYEEYCPQITYNVQAGETYTLLVSHYRPSDSTYFNLPLSFYANGNPIFYDYSSNSPIDRRQEFYRQIDVGTTVTPLFIGGTLNMASNSSGTDNNSYLLTQINTNTVDLQNKNINFTGNFADNNVDQPGVINFKSGTATLSGANTHTGETVVGNQATVIVNADANLGAAQASIGLAGGTLQVNNALTQAREVNTTDSTNSTINVANNAVLNAAGINNSGTLHKAGTGRVNVTTSGDFGGQLFVDAGELRLQADDAIGPNAQVNVSNSATFSVEALTNTIDQLQNTGTVEIHNTNETNGILNVTQDYSQSANAHLYVDLAPDGSDTIVKAQSANLAGTLDIDYFDGEVVAHRSWQRSSDIRQNVQRVYNIIDTTGGITGDFSQATIDGNVVGSDGKVTLNGIPTADYVQYEWTVGKNASNTQYQISGDYNLRWERNDTTYQGQFTIQNNDTFRLDTALADVTANVGWDGKTLTKKGDGTLIMAVKQNYTGDTLVEGGTLFWGFEDNTTISQTQIHQGNYTVKAGATTGLNQTNTFLHIKGNLNLAGDSTSTFDPSNPLKGTGGNDTRSELSIIPGGTANTPEIIVDGVADIQGAYLNVQGLGSTNPNEIFHASSIDAGVKNEYVILHARNGFKGGEFHPDGSTATAAERNERAGFINGQKPLTGIDYLTGGQASIVTCDPLAGLANPCLYGDVADGATTQEYVLSEIKLAWTFGGLTGAGNDVAQGKTGDFTLAANTAFDADIILADQTGGTNVAPDGSGRLGFNSLYGWWDGKTLTKKGDGTLYLSAANTYTGNTDIRQGTLSIADGSYIGGSAGITLGNANSTNSATLEFAKSPVNTNGPAKTEGLNSSNAITVDKDITLGNRKDNAITVVDATHTVTLSGSIGSASNTYDPTKPLSGSSWLKQGAGTLVLAPGAGEQLNYQGDTWVQEGTLTLTGNLSNITGDIYNQAQLVFDVNQNTEWNGKIVDHAPVLTVDAITPLVATAVVKSGTGTLQINGDSQANWNVTGGELAVANQQFNSNVQLASGTALGFVNGTTPITEASYTGTINAASNSTLFMDRAGGTLNLNYTANSTFGYLDVRAGQLNLIQGSSATPGSVQRVTMADAMVRGDATLSLLGKDSYLTLQNGLNLANDSKLEITLDASNPTVSKINADSINIGSNVTLEVLGFAFDNSINLSRAVPSAIINSVFKASDLSGIEFTVLASTTAINGEFTNQAPVGAIINNPQYLVYTNGKRSTGTSPYVNEYFLGGFGLAWTQGDAATANGTFNLERGTGLNVDIALGDRTDGPFTSGWDGKTLRKEGGGLLILSNVGNSYTGNTEVVGGELLLTVDNAIDDSAGVFLENTGVLTANNNVQTIKQLQGGGGAVDLMENGKLIITNDAGSGPALTSTFAANIVGGDNTGTSTSELVVQQGTVNMSGQSIIDKVTLGNAVALSITGEKARLFTNELVLDNNAITLNTGSRLQAFVHDTTNDSSITLNGAGSTWHMLADSEINTVNMNGGDVRFGDEGVRGASGRTLRVNQWNSTGNGVLRISTDLDSSQQPRLDILQVKSATGRTNVVLFDDGGFQALLNKGDKILPIESIDGVGGLATNAFGGGAYSGAYQYDLVYDTETGGFKIDPTRRSSSPDILIKQNTIDNVTSGKRATAVTALGDLSMLNQTNCNVRNSFGRSTGTYGTMDVGSDGKSKTSQLMAQVGSDLVTQEMGDSCVRYGVLAGYIRTSSDVDGPRLQMPNGRIGKTSADTYYLGGYTQYKNSDWYVNGALLGAMEKSSLSPAGSSGSSADATSMIASVEVGKIIPISDTTRVIPSTQLLYQRSSFDDTITAAGRQTTDNVGTVFARAGAKIEHIVDEDVSLQVQANIWHQFDAATQIHSYAQNGNLLNSISHQPGNSTWADLQLGVDAKLSDAASLNFSIGYQGSFNSENSISGRVGFVYRW